MRFAGLFALLVSSAFGCSSSPAPVDASTDISADLSAPQDAKAVDVPDLDLGPLPHDPSAWSPRALGPFHVGYRTWARTYTPAGTTAPRTLNVHVWYPTLAATGETATYYGLFRDRESFVDAPVAAPVHPGGYPVHVYSHGHRGFAGGSAFLMRWFASHGWVCVAPDHTGNTLGDSDPRLPSIYYLRSRDVSAALDALTSSDAPAMVASRAVTNRVLLSGHSFGTHTVWASLGATFDPTGVQTQCAGRCSAEDLGVFGSGVADPRFVAGIPMAGAIDRGWFGPMGHASVHTPLLAMSGTDDPVGDDVQFTTTAPMPLTWIDVRGACHQFFGLTQNVCENIPDSLQGPIVGAWALAFARHHVLNENSSEVTSILDGSAPVSDRVTLHRR